jgi:outer membrane protein OmpA-like peptidoglycan-associated protein
MVLALLSRSGSKLPGSVKAVPKRKSINARPLHGNHPLLPMRHGFREPLIPAVALHPSRGGMLQRKCACGGSASMSGECEECSQKKRLSLQAKLTVNEAGDAYEQEADRIADRVMATSGPHTVSAAPPRIQRFSGQSNGQTEMAPDSVDRVLAGPGRPLEPALRMDMEQRFGYDFSQVRVHTGSAAEQSARGVNAHAYTVGHDIVFGEGQYSPHTLSGQRLLTHELAHTLQQSTSAESSRVVQRQPSLDIPLRSPTVTAQVLGAERLDGFELNSHALTAEHKRRLLALANRLKQLLREHPLGTVEITGHTDATGEEAFNKQLGQDRADAVAAFLRKTGVPAIALLAESAGESALLVPTDKPEPRNRRVEIRFLPELSTPSIPTSAPGTSEPPKKAGRIPTPENFCAEHPEICEPITTKPETMLSCSPTNCSAYGDSFDKLPPDLQLVLTRSFKTNAATWFEQLVPDDRMALKQIFNRLCRYGVWCHARLVLEIGPGEAAVLLADSIFNVPGRTSSVYFTSPAGDALIHALMATGRFCTANGAGASQHKGQTTLREISGSDSLHVSIGPGDRFDAHIDKYSPVPEHPEGGFCSNAPSPAAVGHICRELIPEMVRKGVDIFGVHIPGPPGFQCFPEPAPSAPVPAGAPALDPTLVSITLRGPMRARVSESGVAPPLEPELEELLSKEIPVRIRRDALVPSEAMRQLSVATRAREEAGPNEEQALIAVLESARERVESFADAHELAKDVARRLDQARRSGHSAFVVQLGQAYAELSPAEMKSILSEIRNIARIGRALLGERAKGIYKVWVLFGDSVMWDIDF